MYQSETMSEKQERQKCIYLTLLTGKEEFRRYVQILHHTIDHGLTFIHWLLIRFILFNARQKILIFEQHGLALIIRTKLINLHKIGKKFVFH